jgi:pimeloyl-ACP methyl ester carboxylesterase
MSYVDVGTHRLWVTEKGRGSPVVLLHPLFLDARVFEPIEDALVEEHRLLAVDVRDHGRSEGPPEEWTLGQAVGELEHAMDELGVPSAHLVGVSMGGMIAMRWALAHPDRVRSLALLSTSADAEPRAWLHKAMTQAVRFAGRPATKLLLPYATRRMFSPQAREEEPAVDEWRRRIATMEPDRLHRAGQAVFDREPILDRLDAIDAPALVLVGEEDEAVATEQGRRIADALDAEHEVVPDAGHVLPIEAPETVADELVHFLRRAEAKAVRDAEPSGPDPADAGGP